MIEVPDKHCPICGTPCVLESLRIEYKPRVRNFNGKWVGLREESYYVMYCKPCNKMFEVKEGE